MKRLPADWTVIPSTGDRTDHTTTDFEVALEKSPRNEVWSLHLERERIGAALDPTDLLDPFEHHLQLAVAVRAARGTVLHAGLVSYAGRGLLLPGYSFSGKSTLVAALVEAGARYESDDLVIATPMGSAHGVPRSLNLRQGKGRLRRSARDLGWTPSSKSIRVDQVAFLQFRSGSDFGVEMLTPCTGVLALFSQALTARRHPQRSLAALVAMGVEADFHRGRRGEADVAASKLLDNWRAA